MLPDEGQASAGSGGESAEPALIAPSSDEPTVADAAAAESAPPPTVAEPAVAEPAVAEAAVVEPATSSDVEGALSVVEVEDLDWAAVRSAADAGAVRARMRATVEAMESLLDRAGGPGMLFDADRAMAGDRAIRVGGLDVTTPLWFIGDLHGDLLALEAALALIDRESAAAPDAPRARIVLLGDLFDDGAYGLEVLLRVFELLIERSDSICVIAGNHDEALAYNGSRFTAAVVPADFSDFLDANLAHEWIVRAGKLAVRLFADAPRALFLPDGLLVVHGGIPLADLHEMLRETGDWNDPRCLSDFVWTRAHPRARKKLPNRASRGSQFGYEDFAAFCALSTELGRPVSRMVRGHDHVEERYASYPAYAAHPVLTTVALSRRLPRESFGPYERVPTIARWVPDALPQVYRLHVPGEMIRELYPEEIEGATAEGGS